LLRRIFALTIIFYHNKKISTAVRKGSHPANTAEPHHAADNFFAPAAGRYVTDALHRAQGSKKGDPAMFKAIATDKAPGAIGPYSQGTETQDLVFTSGQLPIDPATKVMPEDISEQTRQALENVKSVLEAAGCSLKQVFKTTVFLADMADFPKVNEVYATYFSEPFPARSCVLVAALPLGAGVEIEVVARR
jgi:2-iminobutanoate/2-iminopropanoate deaminase